MPKAQPVRLSRDDLIALVLLSLAVLIYTGSIFTPLDSISGGDAFRSHDWLQISTYDRLLRRAVLVEHAFPLRTYFLGGGYPLIGNPQDGSLNLFAWISVLLGERLGMKVNLVLMHLLGAWGAYFFCRFRRRTGPAGAAIAGLLLVFSGWVAGRMEFGFYVKFLFLLTPWAFLFLETMPATWAAMVGLGVTLAAVLSQLGLGFEVVVLFLGASALLGDVQQSAAERKLKIPRLLGLAGGCALAALLTAGKLVPMVEILRQNPRSVEFYEVYKEQTLGGTPQFYTGLGDLGLALVTYKDTMNWPVGIGPLGILLAAAGVAFAGIRRTWTDLVLLALGVWLCLGPFAGLDLYRLLWEVPFFGSMHMPFQLFNFFLLWPLVVLAGCGIPSVTQIGWARKFGIPAAIAGVAAIVWLGHSHWSIYDGFFTQPAPELPMEEQFFQVSGDEEMGRGSPRSLHAHQYNNLLRNVGTIDWDGDVLLPENAEPKYWVNLNDRITPNADYRGEVFIDNGNIDDWRFESNSIRVSGRALGPAVVWINQNYDRWWRLDGPQGAHLRPGGILSVEIAEPGAFDIELVYRPLPTLIGLAVTMLGWLGTAVWLVLYLRKRKRDRAAEV